MAKSKLTWRQLLAVPTGAALIVLEVLTRRVIPLLIVVATLLAGRYAIRRLRRPRPCRLNIHRYLVRCRCGKHAHALKRQAGVKIDCPHCGGQIEVPSWSRLRFATHGGVESMLASDAPRCSLRALLFGATAISLMFGAAQIDQASRIRAARYQELGRRFKAVIDAESSIAVVPLVREATLVQAVEIYEAASREFPNSDLVENMASRIRLAAAASPARPLPNSVAN
ncbi:MAG: hypothetical protein AAF961_00910 [Planctomycetota bacterium]